MTIHKSDRCYLLSMTIGIFFLVSPESCLFLHNTSFSKFGGCSSVSSFSSGSCSTSVSSDSSEECGSSGVGSSVFFFCAYSSESIFLVYYVIMSNNYHQLCWNRRSRGTWWEVWLGLQHLGCRRPRARGDLLLLRPDRRTCLRWFSCVVKLSKNFVIWETSNESYLMVEVRCLCFVRGNNDVIEVNVWW